MVILHRKLLRDIFHMRGQAIAIAMVMACGVAAFVAMRAMYRSLLLSQANYYAQYRFADIFAELKRAPRATASRIADIPGVARAQTRIVVDVNLGLPAVNEPVVGRLISIPGREPATLNRLFLRRGRLPDPHANDEAIASEAFAIASQLEVGSKIEAVIHGRWQELRIVGVALSPEYIYEIRGGGSLFPDNRHFGVLWVSEDLLESALDMKGAFNSIVVSLQPRTQDADVIAAMDHILDRYGGLGAYGRSDQISHRFISDEISQNRISATIIPTIFLTVAALLVHLSFTRLVNLQRSELAVIKAFGYSNLQVGIHFVQFSLLIAGAGYLLGCSIGWYFGVRLAALYAEFYRFPILTYRPELRIFLWAGIIAAATAMAGAAGAVVRATSLPPAEAMRPEAPPQFRPTLIDRLNVRWKSATLRMLLRNLERRPWRALASAFAISSSVMIVVVEFGLFDALDRMMQLQFRDAQREDLTVSLIETRSSRSLMELRRMPGVLDAEAFRSVPVRLRFGHRWKKTVIIGLDPDSHLRRMIDREGARASLPSSGLLLSTALADALCVEPGEALHMEVLEGRRIAYDVPVAGMVDEMLGTNAYMNLYELNRLLEEDRSVSGAFLWVDANSRPTLYQALRRLPVVAGVAIREAEITSFRDTIDRSMALSLGTLIVFASIIAAGMIYNGARIALSERERELATLRVLGFTRREITAILLGEQALIALVALPFGFVSGFALCAIVAIRLQTELYRMPLVVDPSSYAWALIIVLFSAAMSGILIRRRIAHLDIVSVLKARE